MFVKLSLHILACPPGRGSPVNTISLSSLGPCLASLDSSTGSDQTDLLSGVWLQIAAKPLHAGTRSSFRLPACSSLCPGAGRGGVSLVLRASRPHEIQLLSGIHTDGPGHVFLQRFSCVKVLPTLFSAPHLPTAERQW